MCPPFQPLLWNRLWARWCVGDARGDVARGHDFGTSPLEAAVATIGGEAELGGHGRTGDKRKADKLHGW